MGEGIVVAAGAVIAAVVVAVGRLGPRRLRVPIVLATLTATAIWLLALVVGWVGGDVPTVPALLLYAVGAAALGLVSSAVFVRASASGAAVLASAIWTLALLVPVGAAVFSAESPWLLSLLGVSDYGGALVIAVPLGALLLARRAIGLQPRAPAVLPHVVPVTALSWLAGVAWLVGVELRLDALTPVVLMTAIVSPLVAGVGWLVVERIRLGRSTLLGGCSGVAAGVGGSLATAGSLDLVWTLVLGAVVGTSSAIVAYSAGEARWMPGGLLHSLALLPVPGAVGLLFAGLFGAPGGLVYTGSLLGLGSQLAGLVAVTVWSAIVALVASVPLVVDRQWHRTMRIDSRGKWAIPDSNR